MIAIPLANSAGEEHRLRVATPYALRGQPGALGILHAEAVLPALLAIAVKLDHASLRGMLDHLIVIVWMPRDSTGDQVRSDLRPPLHHVNAGERGHRR